METSPEGLVDGPQWELLVTDPVPPQWRRAPKGSWTIPDARLIVGGPGAAMETSPEGLVDPKLNRSAGSARASRNGDEPRRARGPS